MTSTPIATAAQLLRESAEELKQAHTLAGLGEWNACEGEVKAIYDEHIAVAAALEAMPASEQAAWHAGQDEGRAQKSCLVQIQEPAVNQQLTTEQVPVWGQSRFHGQQWMSCAAEHVTMVLADQRYAAEGYEARYLYAAPVLAAQPTAWPKNAQDVRDFFRSDFITAQFAAEDQEPRDEDRYLISAHDFVSAVNWWADFPHIPRAPQAAPAAVAVPDEREAFEKFMRLDTSGFTLERNEDSGYKEFEVLTYWHFWQARAALAATPAADAPDMVSVKKDDASNYCRILAALGMEDEGDPVAEVQSLLATSTRLPAQAAQGGEHGAQ